MAQVQRLVARGAELHPRHEDHVGRVGQARRETAARAGRLGSSRCRATPGRGGPGCENRLTPMIRRRTPAASLARRAMRANVGPILPATPRTSRSPSICPSARTAAGVGRLRSSSNASASWISSGKGSKFCGSFMSVFSLSPVQNWPEIPLRTINYRLAAEHAHEQTLNAQSPRAGPAHGRRVHQRHVQVNRLAGSVVQDPVQERLARRRIQPMTGPICRARDPRRK